MNLSNRGDDEQTIKLAVVVVLFFNWICLQSHAESIFIDGRGAELLNLACYTGCGVFIMVQRHFGRL
jgi:hypothetical protein